MLTASASASAYPDASIFAAVKLGGNCIEAPGLHVAPSKDRLAVCKCAGRPKVQGRELHSEITRTRHVIQQSTTGLQVSSTVSCGKCCTAGNSSWKRQMYEFSWGALYSVHVSMARWREVQQRHAMPCQDVMHPRHVGCAWTVLLLLPPPSLCMHMRTNTRTHACAHKSSTCCCKTCVLYASVLLTSRGYMLYPSSPGGLNAVPVRMGKGL